MLAEYIYNYWQIIPATIPGLILIYILVILNTRVFGLKSFSQMTGFDFAMTIAMGSLIASTVINDTPSLLVGTVLITFLFLMNYLISLLRYKSQKLSFLIDNKPLLLMKNGELIQHNMSKGKVTEDELRAKLREANVLDRKQVKAVILETTGDVSVLHSHQEIEVESYLLQGVQE